MIPTRFVYSAMRKHMRDARAILSFCYWEAKKNMPGNHPATQEYYRRVLRRVKRAKENLGLEGEL
jgi:hypothetical protein